MGKMHLVHLVIAFYPDLTPRGHVCSPMGSLLCDVVYKGYHTSRAASANLYHLTCISPCHQHNTSKYLTMASLALLIMSELALLIIANLALTQTTFC